MTDLMRSLHWPKPKNPIFFFLAATFLLVILRAAWMDEDAYITLRTVDNFVHGYGLVWNIGERVQTYTHPLWMFLLTFFYFFTREAFYTSLAVCLATSLAAFVVLGRLAPRLTLSSLAVLSILVFSKAFVDFSTSGLENPATHLLLACFLLVFLTGEEITTWDRRRVYLLGLIACLATLNRMDSLLFYAPALLLVLFKRPGRMDTLKWLALGFLPFLLWEVFSLVYYGFLVPNTAYAKLGIHVARSNLIEQGYLYLLNSLAWDPITLLAIGLAVGWALLAAGWRERSLAIGILFYLFYVAWIGGDYMSGRFLSAALLVAVGLLLRAFAGLRLSESLFLLVFVILLGFSSPTPTLTSVDNDSLQTRRVSPTVQVNDERSFYFQSAGLLYDKPNTLEPFHEWAIKGQQLRNSGQKVYIFDHVGFYGYFAGPGVYLIDELAITDPLLSHLAPIPDISRAAGHYKRALPEGYVDSVRKKQNLIADPDLARYYDKILQITRGDIWSWDRFVAIWQVNTGQFDVLLDQYNQKNETP